MLKKGFYVIIFIVFTSYSYVLKTGSQMTPNEDFEISFDEEFRVPFVHPTDSSLSQDQSIIELLTSTIIGEVIENVNPANPSYHMQIVPTYSIGSEVTSITPCHIEFKTLDDPSFVGQSFLPYYAGNYTQIDVALNSDINTPLWDWGVAPVSGKTIKNPRNTLTHELTHSVGFGHSPSNSSIMLYGGATTISPVPIGADEISGYIALYNAPGIIEPLPAVNPLDALVIVKGQNVDFKILPKVDQTPTYTYETTLYKVKTNLSSELLEHVTLQENDTIRYSWDTAELNIDTMNVECYIKGAEEIGKTTYKNANNETNPCDQRPAKRKFSICDYLVDTPKADTSIVVKSENYIPVRLKTKDYAEILNTFDKVYNSDKMKVKYKLWYDGWLSNDTISTTVEIDPREEFKWYFSSDGADNTINMNHSDLKVNADYQITAWLYAEENGLLKFIDKVDSEEFTLLPEVNLTVEVASKSTQTLYRSLEKLHKLTATCSNPDGTNHDISSMNFYYKFEEDNDYTLITTKLNEKDSLTEYTIDWDSSSKTGKGFVKAVASLSWWSGTTCSDSVAFHLLDGYECDITNPKPYKVEAVDFEKYLDIGGKLFHDGTVDVDTLETMYNISDMQHGGLSILSPNYIDSLRCPAYKYRWFSLQLPWPYGTPLKGSGTGVAYKLDSMEEANTAQEVSKEVVADSIMWCEPLRNDTLFIDEDWAYPTMPGLYRIEGRVYGNNTSYEIAKRDTLVYMKPSWKLKLYGDYWYSYSAQWGKPYVEKTVYAPEERVRLYQWRPFANKEIRVTNFDISYEGKSVAKFTSDCDSYQTYIVDKPDNNNWLVPDTFLVSTAIPAEWVRTGEEAPGFYQVTATELDPLTGFDVIQKKEIQIPPLYVTAETDSSDSWPVSVWPRGEEYEDMENKNNWITIDNFFNPALGKKSLASYYKTIDKKGRIELTHPGVTLAKEDNVEFVFSVALKKELTGTMKSDYAFEELLAKYSIALVINDEEEEIIKSPTVSEWDEYNTLNQWSGDGNDSIYYSVRFVKPLGESVTAGSNIKVRLITEGLPQFFNDTLEQTVLFDEIRLSYTRKVCPKGPAMPEGYYKNIKGNDFVEITFNPPINSPVSPTGYIIYRNGEKAGQTTTTSYIDYDIESNKTYKYSITAIYKGLDYPESSMLDCKVYVTTGTIVNPRPRDFTLTEGGGYEYNTVYLKWTEPVIDSVAVYNVYRNDLLIAQTDTTKYTDLWLASGEYRYYITAKYPDGDESDTTDTLSVNIETGFIGITPPLSDDFENGGTGPEYWESYYMNHPDYWIGKGRLKYSPENYSEFLPYSGNYLAYIGMGPLKNNADYWEYESWDLLRSPVFNFTQYRNVTVKFKYMVQSNVDYLNSWNGIEVKYNNEDEDWFDSSPLQGLYWEAGRQDTLWQDFSYTLPDLILSDNFRILLSFELQIEDPKDYQYFSIDSLVVTGNIKAEVPGDVVISNSNGTVNLSWDTAPDATMYYIYRSPFPDTGYQEIGSSATTAYTDNLTGLEDGVYFYKVVSEVTQKIYQADQKGSLMRREVRK